MVSAALVSSHDGLALSEAPDISGAKDRWDAWLERRGALLARWLALAPDWRAAALTPGLMAGLGVELEADRRNAQARLTATAGKGCVQTLLTLTPPPSQTFVNELEVVAAYADLRTERLEEIELQRSEIMPFFGALDRLDPARTPVTLALLDAAETALEGVTHQLKLALDVPRPIDICADIHPVIATPSHGSFPSGHASGAFLIAALMTRIVDGARQGPDAMGLLAPRFRLAARIAVNRTVAGVHFPADSFAGAALGLAMADWLAARGGAGVAAARAFNGDAYASLSADREPRDFHHGSLRDIVEQSADVGLGAGDSLEVPVDPLLKAVFDQAITEWPCR